VFGQRGKVAFELVEPVLDVVKPLKNTVRLGWRCGLLHLLPRADVERHRVGSRIEYLAHASTSSGVLAYR
jgi:hypothetical protein